MIVMTFHAILYNVSRQPSSCCGRENIRHLNAILVQTSCDLSINVQWRWNLLSVMYKGTKRQLKCGDCGLSNNAPLFALSVNSINLTPHPDPDPDPDSCYLAACTTQPSRHWTIIEKHLLLSLGNRLPISSMERQAVTKRARHACEPCRYANLSVHHEKVCIDDIPRRKKSKCPGERPVCSHCRRLRQRCVYSYTEHEYA